MSSPVCPAASVLTALDLSLVRENIEEMQVLMLPTTCFRNVQSRAVLRWGFWCSELLLELPDVFSNPIAGWFILAQEKAHRSQGWICRLQPVPVQDKGLKLICSGLRPVETSHCGRGV